MIQKLFAGRRTREKSTKVRRARSRIKAWPGKPYPLGATWDGRGVNFAIFSANATRVELCLFDSEDAEEETRRYGCPMGRPK